MNPEPHAQPEVNPYEAPHAGDATRHERSPAFLFPDETERDTRLTYLHQEASIKSIALCYYIAAIVGLINSWLMVFTPRGGEIIGGRVAGMAVSSGSVRAMILASSLLGLVFLPLLGYHLGRLRNWARWVVIVLGATGMYGHVRLLVFLGGTMSLETMSMAISLAVSLYGLYILLGSDSSVVFSKSYRRTVEQTPEIVPRLGARDRVFLGLVGVKFLLGTLIAARLFAEPALRAGPSLSPG